MSTTTYPQHSPMYPLPKRVNVLGVGVDPTNMSETLATIDSYLAGSAKGYICVTGVHGVMEAQVNRQLKNTINTSLVTIPDGRPTVWIGWLTGFSRMRQVTGPNLMLALCARSVEKNYTHFLYGGGPGVVKQLQSALLARFPTLNIVGSYTPPFRRLLPDEEQDLIQKVAALKPDIFWVGLSTPKQEIFMAEYIHKLDTKLMVGVGAAFDIHTGRIADSPEWVKVVGLQWLHRLAQEPKRLWKRYLINNPKFILLVTGQLLGVKRYELGLHLDSNLQRGDNLVDTISQAS